jgi:hypothetical protein
MKKLGAKTFFFFYRCHYIFIRRQQISFLGVKKMKKLVPEFLGAIFI